MSSNIRSASALVDEWRKEVFQRLCPDEEYVAECAVDYLTKHHAVWYNPQREYSSLFEKNFDLPRQRRMFVEQEVAGKVPNLGYAYLVRLIEEELVNTVFTTNFDDLLNEAFFQFSSVRPIVCAHDSSVSSITVTSKRPKVIKLHGDYLFDDIKSAVRETESLEDNIRKKFSEFCRDYGLVVLGYSGCDRSVMDVLQYLLRSDDYLKHGIYWCIRKGEEPSDELLKLLWRDRVYFVEIDGFDELMATLHNDLVGPSLPIDTGVVTEKPKSIISGFCGNPYLADSPSPVIQRDLERLQKQSEKEELFSFLRDSKDEDARGGLDENLSERELVTILQIKQSLADGEFDVARARIQSELENRPSRRLKEDLSEFRVRVEELAGDLGAAIAAVDSLIAEDPHEAENYIRKTYLTLDHQERMRILDVGESVDPENPRIYMRRADCCVDAYLAGIIDDQEDLMRVVEESYEKSWDFDPSLRNPAWTGAVAFYEASNLPKSVVRERLDNIVDKCSGRGRSRIMPLRARLARWSRYKEDRASLDADALLKDISSARLASSKSVQPYYEWLELDAYLKLGRKEELSRRLSELVLNPDLADTSEYLRRKSDFLIKFNGDLAGAITTIKQAVEKDRSRHDILRAAYLMELAKDADGIENLLSDFSSRLRPVDRLALRRSAHVARHEFEDALAQLRARHNKVFVGAQDKSEELHDLLLLTRYQEAASLGKNLLDRVKWNKLDFGTHIINYEISVERQGQPVNRKRLGDLIESTLSEDVKGCACYLLGNLTKATEIFSESIREDKTNRFHFPNWAIFKDKKGREFMDRVLKATE
ncbi:SIR2 family protein [Luteimonas sp. A478]